MKFSVATWYFGFIIEVIGLIGFVLIILTYSNSLDHYIKEIVYSQEHHTDIVAGIFCTIILSMMMVVLIIEILFLRQKKNCFACFILGFSLIWCYLGCQFDFIRKINTISSKIKFIIFFPIFQLIILK
jgi:hypothetical protein